MDALGLVCESHRSTEALTSEEIDLLRHFLPPNLNSQSPGVRQQTVSLLKKVRFVLFDVCSHQKWAHLISLSISNEPWNAVVCSCCAEWRTVRCCCRRDWFRSRRTGTNAHSTCTRWPEIQLRHLFPEHWCEQCCVLSVWCRSSFNGSVRCCWRFYFPVLPSQSASCPYSCSVYWARPSLLAQVHRARTISQLIPSWN